ncbi:MAG TPA: sulfite exporter TauE/SafE family protein [Mariprofundaceae bacterium]|nr:sulfite exporter TauE/SafE family protein [Mariprofundaceae bacterium]
MDAVWEVVLLGLAVGLVAGAVGGTLAGLAGVGGGLIYVPVFYAAMPASNDTMAAHVFGSMVAIVITGFFSARAHWRLGHVDTTAMRRLLPGLLVGAGIGLWQSLQLPQVWVLLGLGLLDGWIAWDYGRYRHPKPGVVPLSVMAGPVGYLSGSLGIGGGTMLVPLLRRHLSLREAVGTSAAAGMIMATGAVTANLLLERNWMDVLADSLPFLAGAWLGILLILPKTSRWAARLHATISEAVMRQLLKLLFMVLSGSLLLAAWLA